MTTANLFGSAIRRYCESACPSGGTPPRAKACTTKACPLWQYRLDRQVELFDAQYRTWWFELADACVDQMPSTFWSSDFRRRFDGAVNMPGPARREWWGALTRRWLRRGYTMTGNSRPSPTPTLRGSREQEWTRGDAWAPYSGAGTRYLAEREKAA